MQTVQTEAKNCCGCTACYSVCPKNAITMQADGKGFLYPAINSELCVNCKLCEKICNFIKFTPNTERKIDCYAVKHKDEREIATSRSGAFFIAVADYVLSKNGVIFGCEMADEFTIIHKAETDKLGVNKFKGSKYVQSDMKDCFAECVSYLKQGRTVLFSGTACQLGGLLSLLQQKNISRENLIAVDIVCHGVPSPLIWKGYVEEVERRKGLNVVKVDFRNKHPYGWRDHRETFTYTDATTTTTNWTNSFYQHIMFRESCYNCSYTTPYRDADFTIADYWGIEKNAPEFDDNKGVSLVMVHTDRARQIFNAISENIQFKKTELSNSLQPNLEHPSLKGKKYDKFWRDWNKIGKRKFYKRYFFPSKAKQTVKKILRKIKNKLKKYLTRK